MDEKSYCVPAIILYSVCIIYYTSLKKRHDFRTAQIVASGIGK